MFLVPALYPGMEPRGGRVNPAWSLALYASLALSFTPSQGVTWGGVFGSILLQSIFPWFVLGMDWT